MRKLKGGGTNVPSSSNDVPDHTPGSPHTQLGLMHLKKLFSEYTHPSHPLSEAEKNDKLYNMLPLFCKVSGALDYFLCIYCDLSISVCRFLDRALPVI